MLYFRRMIVARGVLASALVFMANGATAQSSPFCTTLNGLGHRSPENNQTLIASDLFSKSDLGASAIEHQGECQISDSGQYVLTCTWQFPYRSELAAGRFEAVRNLIAECADDPANVTKDQNVNHPDYYEAYYYGMGNHTLSASIKDKGALQKTLVFLRMK
jgi:hypothetical protein